MSARTIGKSLRLSSPLKVEEEAKVIEKQGIVSILGSDCDRTKAASLRRTLSADMSSKKWLAQNGFSPMKKIASSEELANAVPDSSSSSEGEEEFEGKKGLERPGEADVLRSIQSQKKMENEKPRQLDTWISILSQKANEDSSKLPPPYVHPLVKRSTSSLSEKSLQVCTESLGSETGSDGFSSNAPSETSDLEEDREEPQPQPQLQQEKELQSFDREELQSVKCNYSTSKKFSTKSFPPPLPSLSRPDGPSLHMEFHRNDGRLVLEAVSVPSQNCFRAQRQDGRLLLTFANSTGEEPNNNEAIIDQEEDEVDEMEEEMFENYEEEKDYEVEEDEETEEEDDGVEEEEEMVEKVENENGAKETGIVIEQAPKLSSGVINVHRSALVMKKLMGLDNRNPTWTRKFNKVASLVEMEAEAETETEPIQLPQSLPRPPRVARLIPTPPATASSFNAYEYFWRTKPTVANLINPISHQQCPPLKNNTPKAHEKQEMVLLRGNKADYLVPLVRGCKEPRRSLLIWEPYCIAST